MVANAEGDASNMKADVPYQRYECLGSPSSFVGSGTLVIFKTPSSSTESSLDRKLTTDDSLSRVTVYDDDSVPPESDLLLEGPLQVYDDDSVPPESDLLLEGPLQVALIAGESQVIVLVGSGSLEFPYDVWALPSSMWLNLPTRSPTPKPTGPFLHFVLCPFLSFPFALSPTVFLLFVLSLFAFCPWSFHLTTCMTHTTRMTNDCNFDGCFRSDSPAYIGSISYAFEL